MYSFAFTNQVGRSKVTQKQTKKIVTQHERCAPALSYQGWQVKNNAKKQKKKSLNMKYVLHPYDHIKDGRSKITHKIK